MKIINKKERSKLSEGRDYGLGYAFCERNNNIYKAIQPISPCKDYLNDVVFSEHTGRELEAYGLKTSRKGIFQHDYNHQYMIIKICKKGCKELKEYNNYNQDVKNLDDNYKHITFFINYFENLIFGKSITYKTKIVKTPTKGLYLVKIHKKWCETTYGISLFSFLLRVGLTYREQTDPLYHFYTINNDADKYHILGAGRRLSYFIKNKGIPSQDFEELYINSEYDTCIHNFGVQSFKINNNGTI